MFLAAGVIAFYLAEDQILAHTAYRIPAVSMAGALISMMMIVAWTLLGSAKSLRQKEVAAREANEEIAKIIGALQKSRQQMRTMAEEQTRELREKEERYELVMNGVHDVFWEWDLEGNSFDSSTRLAEILGYEEGEIDLTPAEMDIRCHTDDGEKKRFAMVEHLKGETDFYACEYRVRNKYDEHVWLLVRGVGLRDDAGRVYRMAGSASDITKRKLADDGLQQSQKMEAVGQLAGGIAHEFRNILVGIGGFADMALMDIDDSDQVKLCLDEVKTATDKASKMTNDLLAFSRNEEVHPTFIDFDISEILHDMGNFMKRVLRSDVRLNLETSDQVATVLADPNQLSQVILNLAMNGHDAMPDGGELTIGTRLAELSETEVANSGEMRPGSYAQIFVEDTGSGMDRDTIKRLFEPFFTTKEVGKGTGLGLSVAYGIVERAGGFINVDSTPGEGSRFYVNLPLYEEEQRLTA